MYRTIGVWSTVSLFVISCVFNVVLMYENTRVKRLFTDYIYLSSRSLDSESPKITSSDVMNAREQGKVDGKIEAMLMMNKVDLDLNDEKINQIIQIAESSNRKELANSGDFLSLLNIAAYHKGLHSGMESAKVEADEEYTKGYHKAIDDFTCPETGKMAIPSNIKKEDLPMKK